MSFRPLKTRSFLAPIALVAACFFCLAVANPALAGGPSLTLEASKKRLQPGKSAKLTGTLSNVFSGAEGKTVTLLATPYPYGSENTAGTTTVGPDGQFSFGSVEPDLNTRYRATFDGDVLDGDAQSETVQLFVSPTISFDFATDPFRPVSNAQAMIGYSEAVQPEFLVGKPIFWYFKKTSQKRYKRVETTKLRDVFEGVMGKATIKLPRSRKGYRYQLAFCVDEPSQDIGVGPPRGFKCPRRSFRNFRSADPLMRPVTAVRAYAP